MAKEKPKPSLEEAQAELQKQIEEKKKNDRNNFNVELEKLCKQYNCELAGIPFINPNGTIGTKIVIQNKK